MAFDWSEVLDKLRQHPPSYHELFSAANSDEIADVEKKLGVMPADVKSVIGQTNGAELFIKGGPLLTLLPIKMNEKLARVDWSNIWCIDNYTTLWRQAGEKRNKDWVFAVTSYGGLILQERPDEISEWDTADTGWIQRHVPVSEWIEKVLADGNALMENE